VADGPRIPRGLRRLAVPLAQFRQRSDAIDRAKKPVVYFGSFQDLLGRDAGEHQAQERMAPQGEVGPRVFDEYHFGAWRDTAKELFEGEEEAVAKKETKLEYAAGWKDVNEDLGVLSEKETEFLPITTKAYLYLSGTPFKALATGEFIEEQIFNWTYTDEQRAKEEFAARTPASGTLRRAAADAAAHLPDAGRAAGDRERRGVRRVRPQRVLCGHGHGRRAVQAQERRAEVAGHHPRPVRAEGGRGLKTGTRRRSRIRMCGCCRTCSTRSGFCPTSRPVTRWRTCWPRSTTSSGTTTRSSSRRRVGGHRLDALPPVRKAIGSGFDTKTITLSCGKLTTGVTVPQWSSILMLRNLKSP
jgi:hypothetical protein